MNLEICIWDFKPILMSVVYRTNDRLDFVENLVRIIKEIELKENIKIDRNNMFEYVNIHSDGFNHMENNDLLNYLEIESLKELENL